MIKSYHRASGKESTLASWMRIHPQDYKGYTFAINGIGYPEFRESTEFSEKAKTFLLLQYTSITDAIDAWLQETAEFSDEEQVVLLNYLFKGGERK